MIHRLVLAACLCAGIAPAVHAQTAKDGFTYSGFVRARYETLEGQSRAGFGASDTITSFRSQLLGEYRQGGWKIGAELYDSRGYGTKPRSAIGTAEVNALELLQAYFVADGLKPFGDGPTMAFQAGRFTLNIGSRRLIAADDYRNSTNGYTGLKTDARWADGTGLTLFYVLPQQRRPDKAAAILDNAIAFDHEGFDQQLWGGIVAKPGILGATGELGYYGFAEGDTPGRPTRNRNLQNFDAHLLSNPAPNAWDYEAEVIAQTGTIKASTAANAANLDVAAWFAHLSAGYMFAGENKPRLSLQYDYASGGSGPDYARFDTLFGMRRSDFAPGGIYAQIGRANIATPALRFEFELPPSIDAFLVYRPMWLANRRDAFSTSGVIDPSGRSGNFAGHQLEGRVRWWVVPQILRAELNAAWLAKGRFLDTAPNANHYGNTQYLSVALLTYF